MEVTHARSGASGRGRVGHSRGACPRSHWRAANISQGAHRSAEDACIGAHALAGEHHRLDWHWRAARCGAGIRLRGCAPMGDCSGRSCLRVCRHRERRRDARAARRMVPHARRCRAGPNGSVAWQQVPPENRQAQILQNQRTSMMSAPIAFIHHISAFAVFGALMVELVLVRSPLTADSARKLQIADLAFGISAAVLLVAGLARVFFFEKGAAYYFHTWTFLAKLTLFVIVGIVSIVPTLEFLRWRPAVKAGQAPIVSPEKMKSIRAIIHYELVGVVLIVLCAALMAKGVGLMP